MSNNPPNWHHQRRPNRPGTNKDVNSGRSGHGSGHPSSLTRSQRGQMVVFKDASGKEQTGRAVHFRSDRAIVLMLNAFGKAKSVWEVPYTDIIKTLADEVA